MKIWKTSSDIWLLLTAEVCLYLILSIERFLKRSKSPPYNVSAFPTVLYYQNGKYKFPYNHPQKKDALIDFLDNPTEKSLSVSWAENPESVSNHLTNETFDAFISNHENVMVFFHAMYANDLCADIMIGKFLDQFLERKRSFSKLNLIGWTHRLSE